MAKVEWRGSDKLKAQLKKMPSVVHDAIWDATFESRGLCSQRTSIQR